jgi:alpha-D-ribose 1-methylphosphonate 5-triphosphate synthase subunit PhnL
MSKIGARVQIGPIQGEVFAWANGHCGVVIDGGYRGITKNTLNRFLYDVRLDNGKTIVVYSDEFTILKYPPKPAEGEGKNDG